MHSFNEKARQFAHRRGGEEGGRGAESYDGKKAWSSINYSILSVRCFLPEDIAQYSTLLFTKATQPLTS